MDSAMSASEPLEIGCPLTLCDNPVRFYRFSEGDLAAGKKAIANERAKYCELLANWGGSTAPLISARTLLLRAFSKTGR